MDCKSIGLIKKQFKKLVGIGLFPLLFRGLLDHLLANIASRATKVANSPKMSAPEIFSWAWKFLLWSFRELLPFKYWTALLTDRSGGINSMGFFTIILHSFSISKKIEKERKKQYFAH